MAPPPGRRRSCKVTQDDSCRPEPKETEDANPSEALTSQIASSIRQERNRARASGEAPLKAQQNEQPQWRTLKHRGQKSESSIPATKSPSARVAQKSRSLPPGRRQSEDDDDPFAYDKLNRENFTARRSLSPVRGVQKNDRHVTVHEFPCPYRRRNPVLFNVRDHEHCARRPFSDLGELKYVSWHSFGLAFVTLTICILDNTYGHIIDDARQLITVRVAKRLSAVRML